VAAFAEAWRRGELPGEPYFRLSERGASLDELADAARALPVGAARAALRRVLPRCVASAAGLDDDDDQAAGGADAARAVRWGRRVAHHAGAADPLGNFVACTDEAGTCGAAGCPGTAVGWHNTARATRWTVNT